MGHIIIMGKGRLVGLLTNSVEIRSKRTVGFKKFIILCSTMFFIVFTGCSVQNGIRLNSSFSSSKGHMKASFGTLSGSDMKYVNFSKGENVDFKYKSKIEKGSLSIKLVDSDDNTVLEFEVNKSGTESLEIQKDDKYKVVIEGEKAKGSYDISWTVNK